MLLVVLDAGHGGADTGAIGKSGLTEKEINLKVAKKLELLLQSFDIKTLMTRDIDEFISLEQRAQFANKNDADYFISIHTNSATNTLANGIETYAYKEDTEAYELATNIQQELILNTGLTNRGVKTANFSVLRNTSMPAVLVEISFISNLEEEKLLSNDLFLTNIASGICLGILKHLKIKHEKEEKKEDEKEDEKEHWGQGSLDELLSIGLITTPKNPIAVVLWAEFATVMLRMLKRE